MCGIAGFSISDKDHRAINTRRLSEKLLLQIIQRGRDATGAAWSETDDEGLGVYYLKAAKPANRFVEELTAMPRFSRSAILHTRWATKGSPDNNDNNHPIVVPRIVGVHNGHISNDDEIIAKVGADRIGQVDSEAIFQLIAASNDPLSLLPKLQGRAAIAWFDVEDPTVLHLARLQGSPLVVGQTRHGSTVFASTKEHLRLGTLNAGLVLTEIFEVEEWTYLMVKHGRIMKVQTIAGKAAA